MEEDSIKYTGFSTPQGICGWIIMPFGLKDTLKIFQIRMDDAFKHLNSFLVIYVDDMLISTKYLEEQRKHLRVFVVIAIKKGTCLSEKKSYY